jgi:hypothetical protein
MGDACKGNEVSESGQLKGRISSLLRFKLNESSLYFLFNLSLSLLLFHRILRSCVHTLPQMICLQKSLISSFLHNGRHGHQKGCFIGSSSVCHRTIPILTQHSRITSTYGHRTKRTRIPVCSFTDKLGIGELVVGWVTTSESPLLYVFVSLAICFLLVTCSQCSKSD